MWACYDPIEWLRSPEWAFGWWTFWLALVFGGMATPWRKAAVLFAQSTAVLMAVQMAIIVAAFEWGWRQAFGSRNPSDLYMRASDVLALSRIVLFAPVILFAVPHLRTDDTTREWDLERVAVPAILGVGGAGSLLAVIFVLELVRGGPSTTTCEWAFGLLAITGILIVRRIVRLSPDTCLGASIALLVITPAIRAVVRLDPSPYSTTDDCLADQLLRKATDKRETEPVFNELSRREPARRSSLEPTLSALHRTLETNKPPGSWVSHESMSPFVGHMPIMSLPERWNNPIGSLLDLQIRRGLLGQPMQWLADKKGVPEETRREIVTSICSTPTLPSTACDEATKMLRR